MNRLFACHLESIKDREMNFFFDVISKEKRERLQRFVNQDDVKRSLLGELLVRKIVMTEYCMPNKNIKIQPDTYGKPLIRTIKDFNFNISHSGAWIICAVGEKPVGADIEKIHQIDMDTVKYIFSSEEYATYMSLKENDQTDYFFRLWTLKESCLKAQGEGLRGNLKSVNPSIETGQIPMQKEKVYFKNYSLASDYWISVCGYEQEFDPEIKYVHIQLSDFMR